MKAKYQHQYRQQVQSNQYHEYNQINKICQQKKSYISIKQEQKMHKQILINGTLILIVVGFILRTKSKYLQSTSQIIISMMILAHFKSLMSFNILQAAFNFQQQKKFNYQSRLFQSHTIQILTQLKPKQKVTKMVKQTEQNIQQRKTKQISHTKNTKKTSQTEKDQSKFLHISSQQDVDSISTQIIKFFNNIDQKDLVFDEKTRQTLRKLYPEKQITKNHRYHAKTENQKIKNYLVNTELSQYLKEKVVQGRKQLFDELQQFFKEGSQFFASETTPELYDILSNACDIVFRNIKNCQQRTQELRRFGDLIHSQRMSEKYFYFGFNMFQLPRNKTQQDIPKLIKHYPHYRYILKQQYRQPEGPFADFIEKIGEFIFEIIQDSKILPLLLE